jgi:hypothetical protein
VINLERNSSSGAGSEAESECQVAPEVAGNEAGVARARQVVSTVIQWRRVLAPALLKLVNRTG